MLFIDLDGVLADFSGHVKHHLGFYPHEDEETMQREVPKIKDFWLTIPVLHDAPDLWAYVARFNPRVLSASANWDREACEKAKPLWVTKHFPDIHESRIHVVRRSQKALFAKKAGSDAPCVLVDDFDLNTSEWSRAGGVPILHKTARQSVNHLQRPEIQRLLFPVCA